MEVIVLQHIKIEDPGYIKDLMLLDDVNLTTIELDEGEKIPDDLNKFDAMFCMGGPMYTYMEKEYPWLINEKKKIHHELQKSKHNIPGFQFSERWCTNYIKYGAQTKKTTTQSPTKKQKEQNKPRYKNN